MIHINNTQKLTFLAAILLLFSSFMPDKSPDSTGIKWLSFEEAVALQQKNPKKIILDVYTDWCGWCKKMDKNTYTDPEVIKLINDHYYFVKFNAEQKEDIIYKDKTFRFKSEYRAHELAVSILNGKMSYPSTVFLDENMAILTVVPGYLTPKDINPILKYFGQDIYKSKNWDEYASSMTP